MAKDICQCCYQCKDRWIDVETGKNCHTTCEKYLEYRSGKDKENKERLERNNKFSKTKFYTEQTAKRMKNARNKLYKNLKGGR